MRSAAFGRWRGLTTELINLCHASPESRRKVSCNQMVDRTLGLTCRAQPPILEAEEVVAMAATDTRGTPPKVPGDTRNSTKVGVREVKVSTGRVRSAAMAAAAGFLAMAAYQAAIALGAPLGGASWGGAYDGQLPIGLRIASGAAVGVYVLAALIVLGRGGFQGVPLPYGVLRWGTWALVGLMFVGMLMNLASSSGWERFGLGPVTLILGVLCLFVAPKAGPVSGGD